ncbi:MAG: hypothetical protein ACRCYT_06235 [Cetobacterium sp.]
MYYREYFFYLKERLPERCYEILKECYVSHKIDIEKDFKTLKNSTTETEINHISLPKSDTYYNLEYEILLRENLIKIDNNSESKNYILDRFGIYLLHYMNN